MKEIINNPKKTAILSLITIGISILFAYLLKNGYVMPNGKFQIRIYGSSLINLVQYCLIDSLLLSSIYFVLVIKNKKIKLSIFHLLIIVNFIISLIFQFILAGSNIYYEIITIIVIAYLLYILYLPKKNIYKPNLMYLIVIIAYLVLVILNICNEYNPKYEYNCITFLFNMLHIGATIYLIPMLNYFRLYGNHLKERK